MSERRIRADGRPCQRFDQDTIVRGGLGRNGPFVGATSKDIIEYARLGKLALQDGLAKGYAHMGGDGRIILDREAFPVYGSSIDDVRAFMSRPLQMFEQALVPVDPLNAMQKTDLNIAATGAWNSIYGAIAIIQQAQQQNAYAALPSMGYAKAGFRFTSAAAISSGAGIADGGAVPTTVVPTYIECDVGLKEVAVATDLTNRLELHSTKNDDVTFAGNAQVVFSNFMNAIDTDILVNYHTAAGNNLESIDRVTSNATATSDLSYTSGDEDMYSQDRSSVTSFAGYLNENAGVERPVSLSLIEALFGSAQPYWGNDMGNKFWLTGVLTQTAWSFLEGGKQRFSQETVVNSVGEGIQPVIGQAGGFKLATYDNFPIVVDANVTKNTTLPKIYLIDKNHMWKVMGRPIEAIQGNNPLYLGYHLDKLEFYGIMELWADLPMSCGQLRDLL